jgi:hypothetical protein
MKNNFLTLRSRLRNPLAFPAGLAFGFDPKHLAAPGSFFSGVPNSGNFRDILSGEVGTIGGAPTAVIDGNLGPALNFAASADNVSFTPNLPSTAALATCTLAAIFRVTTQEGTDQPPINISNGSTFGQCIASNNGSNVIVLNGGISTTITGFALPSNNKLPLFMAASYATSPSVWNIVVVNLLTGQTYFQQNLAYTASNTTTTVLHIGNHGSSRELGGHCACAMASTQFMSIAALMQWAADPWKFWYP